MTDSNKHVHWAPYYYTKGSHIHLFGPRHWLSIRELGYNLQNSRLWFYRATTRTCLTIPVHHWEVNCRFWLDATVKLKAAESDMYLGFDVDWADRKDEFVRATDEFMYLLSLEGY